MLLLIAFIAILLGIALGVGAFILLEALALENEDDSYFTFSTYWKRAKRRHPHAKILLNLAVSGLCVLSVGFAVWLFGHLVLELW